MKLIPVHSKKYGIKYAQVSDIDYPHLIKHHWMLQIGGRQREKMYCSTRYIDPSNRRKCVPMHRILLGLTNPKDLCDHKDGNGLNNQRENIRPATYGQNSMNKAHCRRNLSGYKGVVLNRENKYRKYCAVIIANGKRIFGGGFKTPEEAARKWNEMAREQHGEFAYQNPV